MSDLSNLFKSAESDQMQAAFTQFAKVMHTYYSELIKAGMTVDGAMQIVRDFHWVLCCKAHYPDQPPTRGPNE